MEFLGKWNCQAKEKRKLWKCSPYDCWIFVFELLVLNWWCVRVWDEKGLIGMVFVAYQRAGALSNELQNTIHSIRFRMSIETLFYFKWLFIYRVYIWKCDSTQSSFVLGSGTPVWSSFPCLNYNLPYRISTDNIIFPPYKSVRNYFYYYKISWPNLSGLYISTEYRPRRPQTVGPTYVKGLLTMQQLAAVVTWSESCELKLNNHCGNVLPSKNGRS